MHICFFGSSDSLSIMVSIIFVNSEGDIAGAENSLLLLIRFLREGYYVSLVCPRNSPLAAKAIALGVVCYDLTKHRTRDHWNISWIWTWLCRIVQISMLLRRIPCDYVHSNSVYAAISTILPAWLMGKKHIWHARDFSRSAKLVRVCSWLSLRIVAVSHSVERHLVSQGVNANKIEVIYNGVELTTGSKDKFIRARRGKNNESLPLFANVGQLVAWKKQALFLDAASRLVLELPQAKFLIVGDNVFHNSLDYKHRLLRLAANLDLLNHIVFVDWQSDMSDIWRDITCLVHTADREPFGRVIIEAMQHCVPVIAADGGGPSEIIEHNISGILVPPNNSRELSRAMLELATDSILARKLAISGYDRARRCFSAEVTARRVAKIYQELLAK